MNTATESPARRTHLAGAGFALEQWSEAYPHPERELAAAVIEAAAEDLSRYRGARTRGPRRLYWSAHDWIASDGRDWPFSFANLCDVLQLSAEALRGRLFHLADGLPEPARPPRRDDSARAARAA
jgi:hypothetical protein